MPVASDTLKARHQLVRDDQPAALSVESTVASAGWHGPSGRPGIRTQLIFLWIALNAACAHKFGFEERAQIRRFHVPSTRPI